MFKIPEDVENELSKKYPQLHVRSFVNDLIRLILEKTLKDSACTIREFGKYIAFKTFSSRNGKEVIRFKFNIAHSLRSKLKDDDYLLKNLPIKAKNQFTQENEEKCEKFQDQKHANITAQKEAKELERKRTQENLARSYVLDIINE